MAISEVNTISTIQTSDVRLTSCPSLIHCVSDLIEIAYFLNVHVDLSEDTVGFLSFHLAEKSQLMCVSLLVLLDRDRTSCRGGRGSPNAPPRGRWRHLQAAVNRVLHSRQRAPSLQTIVHTRSVRGRCCSWEMAAFD